jgi:type II secretory pathway pseudopilin PulG
MTACNPLLGRFIAGIILVIIVIGALTAFTATTTQSALRESIRDELKVTAGIMATHINKSDLEGISPGSDRSEQYAALVNELRMMRSMNDRIINAYIYTINSDRSVSFLVDDLYFEYPEGAAMIGELSDNPDTKAIFGALSLPTASEDTYSDRWGSFISGYAPIDDSSDDSMGSTQAILGVDMAAEDYKERLAKVQNTVIASGVIAALVSACVIAVLYIVVQRKTLEDEAKEEKGPETE